MTEVKALALSTDLVRQFADTVQEKSGVSGLHQLEIHAPHVAIPVHRTTQEAQFLMWLLACARQLNVLNAYMRRDRWYPHMPNLKHLVLVLSETGNLEQALLAATALKTLHLSSRRIMMENDITLEVESMYLRKLPSLCEVALRGLRPTHMSLPKHCGLHIDDVYAQDLRSYSSSAWQALRTNVRNVGLIVNSEADLIQAPSDIMTAFHCSPFVSALNKLTFLCMKENGMTRLDLGRFQQFKRLSFRGENLKLRLPKGVFWEALRFDDEGSLDLEIEDAQQLPSLVPSFFASQRGTIGMWLAELTDELNLQSIPWGRKKIQFGRFNFQYSRFGCNAGLDDECCCGACMKCLIAAGHAVKLPVADLE